MGKQFFYRGYLTSCNYSCGYCPFSKRRMTEKQKKKDQEALVRFIHQMEGETEKHALQIVPYGEALIHEYYWKALAGLSQIPSEEYTGCQTNLSFPVEKMLSLYEACGGQKRKLRLWCTFHPSMTTLEEFISQCHRLDRAGVVYCVGAVGDPKNLSLIRELRERLSEEVYVWINKMDGMHQRYTGEEIQRFQEIDPYFPLELKHYRADSRFCRHSVFQEADGRRYFCNLHAAQAGADRHNQYALRSDSKCSNRVALQSKEEGGGSGISQSGDGSNINVPCRRRECSCYLAYCNRTDSRELIFFEPYPAFRIPVYPKAIFLDVDGTLVAEGERGLSDAMAEKIRFLLQKSKLYLATALPYPEAMGKCRRIADCLSGGVFADGAHILVWEDMRRRNRRVKWEEVIPFPEDIYSDICQLMLQYDGPESTGKNLFKDMIERNEKNRIDIYAADSIKVGGFAISCSHDIGCRTYQIRDVVYKQTLFSKRKRGWMPGEAETIVRKMGQSIEDEKLVRFHIEKRHIGIVSAEADKKTGVEMICGREGIAWNDGMAVGNEKEDLPMLSLFPRSVYLT